MAAVDGFEAQGSGHHGSIASWAARIDHDELPVVRGDLVHHARGCYATLVSFKERMRAAERLLVQRHAPPEQWERVLFWQFHDVLAGTCIEEVYDEAGAELTLLENELAAPVPGPGAAPSFVARHRLDETRPALAREPL
ncbi:MAG TPA: hypothetical protein VMB72_16510, partial [Acidimicrobiales bacterium]|nr:hypothetical protein [Acidimicrobiales bacterium]